MIIFIYSSIKKLDYFIMKNLKNWKLFTENYSDNEPEYLLRINTQYVGDEEDIELDYDFDYDDYMKYKNDEQSEEMNNDFMQQAIDKYGLEWEIEDNELVITTRYVGQEERVEDEDLEDYSEEDLMWMAIESMGIDWEIVPNKEHPNYEKNKKVREFNL